jgi:transposase InsO family protein
LGISKRTYYACQEPGERLDQKYQQVKDQVRLVIEKHPKYGVERIKADLLRRFKVTIGRDVLGKLLEIWALSLPRRHLVSAPSGIQKILCHLAGRANLLIRSAITAPFQAVTSDGVELVFNHGQDKLWLVTHKDVYGQMVYGHAFGETLTTALALKSYQQAQHTIAQLQPYASLLGLLCHQDRGSLYTSYDYVEAVLGSGGRLSYSDPGTPTHNPGQESFHGRLKDEYKDDIFELETAKEVIAFVIGVLNDYNQDRLHTSIGNQTPFEYTKQYLQNPSVQCTVFRD